MKHSYVIALSEAKVLSKVSMMKLSKSNNEQRGNRDGKLVPDGLPESSTNSDFVFD